MPAQKAKSGLYAKMGQKLAQAHEAHKGDETTFDSFGELPAGIENGVAQLVDCKFDQVKAGKEHAGEYYFYAAGVVKRPLEVDTKDGPVQVEGRRTSITEPLYETSTRSRKTVDDHLQWVLNEMRKLGVDTSTLDVSDLEATAAALKEAAPHFSFRTWKGAKATSGQYKDKEPRVSHVWNGACEYNEATGEVTGGMIDGTAGATENGGQAEAGGEGGDESIDIDALVALAAKEGDAADSVSARETLTQLATQAGATEADIKNADSWADVAAMLGGSEEQAAPAPPPPQPPAEPPPPEKGKVYGFRPIDFKTKQPFKNPVQVEVTAVDTKTKTVNLKNVATPKIVYNKVKWDQLLPA